MAKRRLISSYGEIWSITERGWRRWLLAHARGEHPDLRTFGGRSTGYATNITDMSPHDAKLELEMLGDKSAKLLSSYEYDYGGSVTKRNNG